MAILGGGEGGIRGVGHLPDPQNLLIVRRGIMRRLDHRPFVTPYP
jgi:hypothetical protein